MPCDLEVALLVIGIEDERGTRTVGDPRTRPCNPNKIWVMGLYFALRSGFQETDRVRNGVLLFDAGILLQSGLKFDSIEMIYISIIHQRINEMMTN